MPAQHEHAVVKVLEIARRKLLETGNRNRLVHVNRANQRANCLNIINEQSDDVYEILCLSARRMRFKAMGKDKEEDTGQEMVLALPDSNLEAGSDRYTDQFLETPLGPEALARRLLRIAGSARTAEEEQGLNILYLAMGFLRWRESKASEIERESPLVLLPVDLVRNERTSAYELRVRDDDLSTNLPLQERLLQEFGLSLPNIEDEEGWVPSTYFDAVEEVISEKAGWSIDRNGMQLGFFSFAKLLMHRDLDPDVWPVGSLTSNGLLKGLLTEGFEAEPPTFGPDDKLDVLLDPADIIQVIDADASQTKVIEEVRRGASLVVQGPPGTGKSQTITNIIAAAVHDGKTVLFVAEKMAALSVVHDRLVRTGLEDICLELHSRTANKKAVAQELGRTLKASMGGKPEAPDPSKLREARDELNRITELLHQPMCGGGESPFSAMAEVIGFRGREIPVPNIPLDGLDELSRAARAEAVQNIKKLQLAFERVGARDTHSFRGVGNLELQPTDVSRLEVELKEAVSALKVLSEAVAELSRKLSLAEPASLKEAARLARSLRALGKSPNGSLDQIAELFERAGDHRLLDALQRGHVWKEARAASEDLFSVSAWSADLTAMRGAIVRGQGSWLYRVFGAYRRASAELATLLKGTLPKEPSDKLALVDRLMDIQEKRQRLSDDETWVRGVLGNLWSGESTAFEELLSLLQWLGEIKRHGTFDTAQKLMAAAAAIPDPDAMAESLEAQIEAARVGAARPIERLVLDLDAAGLGETLELADVRKLEDRLGSMSADVSGYADWIGLEQAAQAVIKSGAGAIVEAVFGGRLLPESAQEEFLYACAEARWKAAIDARPDLSRLAALDRHDLVSVFCVHEHDRLDEAKALVLARHYEQIPKGSAGEMAVIRGEIGRKRRHKPIRQLMMQAGSMVQRIKPVMLMSPISVAQFLPPGAVSFDLLVIDEASQIRPEDAFGVIARAKQIVVVGDQKQLPPTSFFDRLVDNVEDRDDDGEEVMIGATAADMESVLSLCEARGLRSRMLEWHYRSRDPSLIQVSNAEFYGDNLVLPPSPLELDNNYGLKFHRVPGVYVRGGSGLGRQGTNRVEAQAVVAAVAAHAQNWPDFSLGVVTFSKAQADIMTEILELERRRDPILDAFLREGKAEDVFVKNIENVQGDERDVILISVGYGPQEPNGRLTAMTFGPVNSEGGERRLNVLFSRSRVRCEVFASFDPGDIDPARVRRDGPRVLKRFLEFAKSGIIEHPSSTGLGPDSPFEEDVARVIRSFGYEADPQVGSSGFQIDIGVRHHDRPGQYILAVECDGATYHSALWARERDRLRQEILENLGWRFHRIWSTDWFQRPVQEIERLKTALESARIGTLGGIAVRGSNSEGAVPDHESTEKEEAPVVIEDLRITIPTYRRADVTVDTSLEPHEAPVSQLVDVISEVVEIEGPIHLDELTRRVSAAFGKSRTGSRIANATNKAFNHALQLGRDLVRRGDFIMTASQLSAPPVRDRSGETGGVIKPAYLPPEEVIAAVELVERESGSMDPNETIRAVARLLGYQRVGSDLSDTIARAISGRARGASV